MKLQYAAYIASLKKHGHQLTAYRCPDCDKEIETLVPPKGDQYDSLTICPHCGREHFKIVHSDGRVDARLAFTKRGHRVGRTHAARRAAGGTS